LEWSILKDRSSWLRVRQQQTRIELANGAGSWSAPFFWIAKPAPSVCTAADRYRKLQRIANNPPRRLWVNFAYELNKKLPAQKAGGRYKGNPYNGDTVL
jgi:hypothetical protein